MMRQLGWWVGLAVGLLGSVAWAQSPAAKVPAEVSAVAARPDVQRLPVLASDAGGGLYLGWSENSGATDTPYAGFNVTLWLAKVGARGMPAGWGARQIASTRPPTLYNQASLGNLRMVGVSDGIVACWTDPWEGTTATIVRVLQRYDELGNPRWPAPLRSGTGGCSALLPSLADSVLVAEANAGGQILRRIDGNGTELWSHEQRSPVYTNIEFVSDGAGGAVYSRTIGKVLWMHRISASGAGMWSVAITDGITVGEIKVSGVERNGNVTTVQWSEARADQWSRRLYVQHVDDTGHTLLTANGFAIGQNGSVTADGRGNLFRAEWENGLKVSKYVGDQLAWRQTASEVGDGLSGTVSLRADGRGGVFAAWNSPPRPDEVPTTTASIAWLAADGTPQWAAPIRLGRGEAGASFVTQHSTGASSPGAAATQRSPSPVVVWNENRLNTDLYVWIGAGEVPALPKPIDKKAIDRAKPKEPAKTQ